MELTKNLDCPCSYPGCSRKTNCAACLKYHLDQKELPACCFPPEVEKTYDRSFTNFIKCYTKDGGGEK